MLRRLPAGHDQPPRMRRNHAGDLMTATIDLIFGCHSHQPVGNFPEVFRDAYEKAYRPFVDVLEQHPHMHVTLHYTGPLLDWFLENEPDFIARLRDLIQSGQVEIMGGA